MWPAVPYTGCSLAGMSTPPGRQQHQRQHVGGARGRGQSTPPSSGAGRGEVQQAARGRRGRRSKKNVTPPRFSRKPNSAVPAAVGSPVVNEEASTRSKVASSSGKSGRSSEATSSATSSAGGTTTSTLAASTLAEHSDASTKSRMGNPSWEVSQKPEQLLVGAWSLSLAGSTSALDTVLPTATAESHTPAEPTSIKGREDDGRVKGREDNGRVKGREDDGRTAVLSDMKSEDFGVARRLLNFTRGSGEREAEQEASPDPSSASTELGDRRGSKEAETHSKGVVKQESDDRPMEAGEGAEGKVLSKAELKRQRREKQEAQRLAKQQKRVETVSKPSKPVQEIRVSANVQADDEKMQAKVAKKLAKQQIPQRTETMKLEMFSHLHQYRRELPLTKRLSPATCSIHPAIIKLGLQYADGIICGSNARCIALLAAFKQVIQDYSTPPEKVLSRDLEHTIKPFISFLAQSRPLSVSMGNAIKYLKWRISTVPPDMPEEEAKKVLCLSVDEYYRTKILYPDRVIQEKVAEVIRDGDVILVHAFSSIVLKSLTAAHKAGKDFRVIVVDSRPKLEGRECLHRLVKSGIKCSYTLINAVSYIMKEVTKVLVGAHALLANGYVMSRVGTSLVALVAKTFNVPVLVCCETYKFCERVQTDAFVFNELGDPADVARSEGTTKHLADWKDMSSLAVLNLVYDVTSPDHVAMVITERGNLPCTSVPVVLRVSKDEESRHHDSGFGN